MLAFQISFCMVNETLNVKDSPVSKNIDLHSEKKIFFEYYNMSTFSDVILFFRNMATGAVLTC